MADSITRIVPPSGAIERSTELRREQKKNPADGRRKRAPEPTPQPGTANVPTEDEPLEPDKELGTHLDINV